MKISPVLFVASIEEALPFWVDRLGFEKTIEVPQGDSLGFVILEKGGVEVMLQTHASVAEDIPAMAGLAKTGKASLFIEVDDFDDIRSRLTGLDRILEERVAGYGMREVGVLAPGGHALIFAKPVAQSA
jgi:uncharacterized glyoxalase superfamily protein PhnB